MSQRLIHPHELVGLAAELAGRGTGPEDVQKVKLRHATSTAYYACFHLLSQLTVQRLLGPAWTVNPANVARWITHTGLKNLCEAGRGRGNEALRAALEPIDPRLKGVCKMFITLQEARESADYDSLYSVSKAVALTNVALAEQFMTLVEELSEEGEPSFERLLRLALGGERIAKRR